MVRLFEGEEVIVKIKASFWNHPESFSVNSCTKEYENTVDNLRYLLKIIDSAQALAKKNSQYCQFAGWITYCGRS